MLLFSNPGDLDLVGENEPLRELPELLLLAHGGTTLVLQGHHLLVGSLANVDARTFKTSDT